MCLPTLRWLHWLWTFKESTIVLKNWTSSTTACRRKILASVGKPWTSRRWVTGLTSSTSHHARLLQSTLVREFVENPKGNRYRFLATLLISGVKCWMLMRQICQTVEGALRVLVTWETTGGESFVFLSSRRVPIYVEWETEAIRTPLVGQYSPLNGMFPEPTTPVSQVGKNCMIVEVYARLFHKTM